LRFLLLLPITHIYKVRYLIYKYITLTSTSKSERRFKTSIQYHYLFKFQFQFVFRREKSTHRPTPKNPIYLTHTSPPTHATPHNHAHNAPPHPPPNPTPPPHPPPPIKTPQPNLLPLHILRLPRLAPSHAKRSLFPPPLRHPQNVLPIPRYLFRVYAESV
jgi:hypothetical protein